MSKLYLAHPFLSRIDMRQWELHIEVACDIEIVNPFYDLHRDDVVAIDEGRAERYEKLDPETLVTRDLQAITNCDGIIAYVNGDLSYGTIMEIVYAHLAGLPVYLIVTNDHQDHPWLQYHAEQIFTSRDECEVYLKGL